VTSAVARPGTRLAAAAVAGLLAGAAGLAAAELVAALVAPAATPLVVVGGAFVDLTPRWLERFAISTFDGHDKTVLLAGSAVAFSALAALAGVLGDRWPGAGTALVGLLGLVAVTAALTRPGAGPVDALPSLVGAGVGASVLGLLLRRLPRAAPSERTDGSRRAFLTAVGATGALALLAIGAAQVLARPARAAAAGRARLHLPNPLRRAPAAPSGLHVPGITPWQTPTADFYRVDTALLVPRVDPADWRLRVHGLVRQEAEIGFDDLLHSDLVEEWVTLTCVSNEVGGDLAGNARWLGYPVARLLDRAGPREGADMVLSTSADGFTAGTPLAALRSPRALLAIGMNGAPLPFEHGYPVRMVVPGLYGYVSATKWVVDLEVTRFVDATAYWTDRGWSPRGPIKTASRIDVPRASTVPAGRQPVAGVAWAQGRGVSRVEVQVDDAPWRAARLAEQVDVDSWRQWVYDWDAAPGSHTLRVRATDGTGAVQTGQQASPVPDGATGWHTISVEVTAASAGVNG
jgi:DMSO/TMAO reductase YedYZ molybdopterin-dependent catalytic subunit